MDYFSRLFGCCMTNRKERNNEDIKKKIERDELLECKEEKSKNIVKSDEMPTQTPIETKEPEVIPVPLINPDDELLIDERFIREEEKGKITFTKNGIISFINTITDEEHYNWIQLYNKNDLVIHYQNGSILSKTLLLGKTYYKLSKSLIKSNVDYEFMAKVMYDPEIRKRYDTTLKEYKIYEKGENYHISKTWLYSPIFFIAERDVINKRIEFIKDDVYYNFATSVNDDYEEPIKDIVRCKTYLNLLVLKQDEENFYFHCLSQYDAKSIIPEKILNITIPLKTQEWFNNYIKQLNICIEENLNDK